VFRAVFEAPQCSSQERDGSGGIRGFKMVECRRYLNQRLEKALFRFFKCEPDTFPMFMSQKELASPVAGEASS
jgi:hypothetical protein